MSFIEFLALNLLRPRPERIRPGQHLWNTLREIRPDLSEHVWNTPLDSYYSDDRIVPLLNYLVKNW